MSITTAATMSATPTSSSPLLGSWKPKNVAATPRTRTMPPRSDQRRIASSGDSRYHCRSATRSLEPVLEAVGHA